MEIPAASENVNESLFPINLWENVENSGIAEIKSISQSFKHVTEEDKEGEQKANESDIILSENKMNDSVTVRCVTFLLILNSLNSCISFSLILYYWN